MSLLIALPMTVCGIFALELLLCWLRRRDAAQGWLAVWALTATLLYGGHFLFFHHVYGLLPLGDTVYIACNLAVYPLYLIYISELTDRQPISSVPSLLVPLLGLPVLVALLVWGLYAGMTETETKAFLDTYLYGGVRKGLTGQPLIQALAHDAAHVVFALQVVGVMVSGIRKIRRYNQRLKLFYADTGDKQLEGITVILWLLVITSLFSVLVNAIGRYYFESSLLLALPSLVFSALLFCIGWMGLHTTSLIEEIEQEVSVSPEVVDSTELAGVEFALLAKQFDQLMTAEQLYLMHDLRMDTVVRRLGTNRTYLLGALKQEMGMTFNEYVNRKRIAYARRLIEANPTMLKSDVAAQAGYNSLSAFYRNLKMLSD